MVSIHLDENLKYFADAFDGSLDYICREFHISGTRAAFVTMEGLVNKQTLAQSVMNPITHAAILEQDPVKKFDYLKDFVLSTVDQQEVVDYKTALNLLMSGFALLLVDGCLRILAIGVQGFSLRSISEPKSEVVQRGSREGFVESLQVNVSMIRRRMKTPLLKFERMTVGEESNTAVCLCYLRNTVSQEILSEVRNNIKSIPLKNVLAAGYLTPFIAKKKGTSIFSCVGLSERPDTICGKISEGRVAVIIDGTPNVLVVPHLFIENFQSFDDYANRPYYATFTRLIKYLAFFLAIFLPGFYVSVTTFHPELILEPLLIKIAQSETTTPFPIMLEALVIHIIYEIMREAGLRAPKSLSHAVSIVGALVIGEAAVNSGLVGAPTLMVIAVSAISSYAVPNLYESIALLRLIFIVLGGSIGFWGISLGFLFVLINICSNNLYGIPLSAPVAPFGKRGMRDVLIRSSWKKLGKSGAKIQDMPGAKLKG